MVAGMVEADVCLEEVRCLGAKVMVMLVSKVVGMVWSWSGLWVGIPESNVSLDGGSTCGERV